MPFPASDVSSWMWLLPLGESQSFKTDLRYVRSTDDGGSNVDNDAFGALQTSGLVLGLAALNLDVKLVGVSTSASQDVEGIVTVLSTVDDKQIYFNQTASVFHALAAQADNGISGLADVTLKPNWTDCE